MEWDTPGDFRGWRRKATGHVLRSRRASLGFWLPSRTTNIRHAKCESGFRLEGIDVLRVDSQEFPPIVKDAEQVMEWGWLSRLGHCSQLSDHLVEQSRGIFRLNIQVHALASIHITRGVVMGKYAGITPVAMNCCCPPKDSYAHLEDRSIEEVAPRRQRWVLLLQGLEKAIG